MGFSDDHGKVLLVIEFIKRTLHHKYNLYRLTPDDIATISNGRGWDPNHLQDKIRQHAETPPLTDEEAQELLAKWGTTSMISLSNDTMETQNKILGYVLKGEGRKDREEVFQDINDANFLCKVSKDNFNVNLTKLLQDGRVEETESRVTEGPQRGAPKWVLRAVGAEEPRIRAVTLCEREVEGNPNLMHWCLKVTEKDKDAIIGQGPYFEIFGKYLPDSCIVKNRLILEPGHEFDPLAGIGTAVGAISETGTSPLHVIGYTTKTDLEIKIWHLKFFSAHPYYNLMYNNCRHHAEALAYFLTGEKIGNGISSYGNAIQIHL